MIPAFYARDASGRPREWTAMMTASIRTWAPSSTPAAWCATTPSAPTCRRTAALVALAADSGAGARGLAALARADAGGLAAGERRAAASRANGSVAVGSDVRGGRASPPSGPLSPDDVRVEVVAGVPDGDGGLIAPHASSRASTRARAGGRERFLAVVPAAESGRLACAARVVPLRPDGAGPEPDFLIAWADD